MQKDKRLRRKVRNSYIISTVSIALVLFLLGSVGYLIITALEATDKLRESISVYVMLEDGLDDQRKNEIKEAIVAHDAVRDAVYVSKEKAAADFKDYAGEDFEKFLDFNPLPDSYEVMLSAGGSESDVLRQFEKTIASLPGVDEVVYQRSVVDEISSNLNLFNLIMLMFGATLLFISLILLNNTIRVTVFSKRYIISTMKLVGATKGFIMKPFLISALMQGVYAALISSVMFGVMMWGLHRGLPEVRFGAGGDEVLWIIGGMFLLGILISFVFTIFAVNKFIKMPANAVHYY